MARLSETTPSQEATSSLDTTALLTGEQPSRDRDALQASQEMRLNRSLEQIVETTETSLDTTSRSYTVLNNSQGEPIASLIRYPRGESFMVSPGYAEEVREILKKNGVFFLELVGTDPTFVTDGSVNRGSTFVINRELTADQISILRTPAEVINGTKVIVQGEFTTISPDSPFNLVGTFGIGSCRGIIISNPRTGQRIVAHLDETMSELDLYKIAVQRLGGGDPTSLLVQSTNNIDPMVASLIREQGARLDTNLPTRFTVGRDGEIRDFPQTLITQTSTNQSIQTRMNSMELRLTSGFSFLEK